MEKINIAELLKDCPKGMELDCTMYDNCTYAGIEDVGYIDILINTPSGRIRLTKEGCYIRHDDNAKCVIFPKGKTTWEGFHRPFKDGDILAYTSSHTTVFIYRNKDNEPKHTTSFYVGYTIGGSYHNFNIYDKSLLIALNGDCDTRFATEEEKARLFQAIKANGYEWNPETKTLEKLIEPKFKVGDKIKYRSGEIVYRIVQTTEDSYVLDNLCSIPISIEHMYNLVPTKFDINTLVPFESRVLVREDKKDVWRPTFYGFFHQHSKRFYTTSCGTWLMCIPYDENTKHLTGTTNDCDDFYKTWEK